MHDPDYLEDNIAVVERDLVAGKVQNLPAYLLVALRKDYRPAAVRIRTASADSAGSPELIESHESPGISLDRLRTQLLAMRLQAALDRLDPAERTALERDYIVRLEQGNGFEARLILGPVSYTHLFCRLEHVFNDLLNLFKRNDLLFKTFRVRKVFKNQMFITPNAVSYTHLTRRAFCTKRWCWWMTRWLQSAPLIWIIARCGSTLRSWRW